MKVRKKILLAKIEALELKIMILEAQVAALSETRPQLPGWSPYEVWCSPGDVNGKLTIPADGDGTVRIVNSDLKIRTE